MRPDNSIPNSGVFCDGFAVTFSPDDSPRQDLARFLQLLGFGLASGSAHDVDLWRYHDGSLVHFKADARHHRVYVHGQALAVLRSRGAMQDCLALLASQNHRVTRVDAAIDFAIDAAPVVADLRKQYPASCSLTRKAIETWSILSARPDGVESGSFYVGKRGKSKVQARVYDKQLERLQRAGIETGPTVRYEVAVKGDFGPTLRDVALPESMFYYFASPALLQAPSGVDLWEPGRAGGWSYDRPSGTPWEALKRRVDGCADLGALADLADAVGPSGRVELLRLISRRIGVPLSSLAS